MIPPKKIVKNPAFLRNCLPKKKPPKEREELFSECRHIIFVMKIKTQFSLRLTQKYVSAFYSDSMLFLVFIAITIGLQTKYIQSYSLKQNEKKKIKKKIIIATNKNNANFLMFISIFRLRIKFGA